MGKRLSSRLIKIIIMQIKNIKYKKVSFIKARKIRHLILNYLENYMEKNGKKLCIGGQ